MVVIIDQQPEEESFTRASFWYDSITKGTHMVRQAVALKHEKVCVVSLLSLPPCAPGEGGGGGGRPPPPPPHR